ncbi:MAG: hypothetical protein HY226_03560 [Candidatus Vogelbacteria bacterium]|nr:hypothetical protein [Candidatus Vogelbacteria bacterium]
MSAYICSTGRGGCNYVESWLGDDEPVELSRVYCPLCQKRGTFVEVTRLSFRKETDSAKAIRAVEEIFENEDRYLRELREEEERFWPSKGRRLS